MALHLHSENFEYRNTYESLLALFFKRLSYFCWLRSAPPGGEHGQTAPRRVIGIPNLNYKRRPCLALLVPRIWLGRDARGLNPKSHTLKTPHKNIIKTTNNLKTHCQRGQGITSIQNVLDNK